MQINDSRTQCILLNIKEKMPFYRIFFMVLFFSKNSLILQKTVKNRQ